MKCNTFYEDQCGTSCFKSEGTKITECPSYTDAFGWLFWRINVDLAIFQPYLDLEAGDNQSLKIQVARPGIEPRSSCSASQELNHSATAAPYTDASVWQCCHINLFHSCLPFIQ